MKFLVGLGMIQLPIFRSTATKYADSCASPPFRQQTGRLQ